MAKPWGIRYGAQGFGALAPIDSVLLRLTMLLRIAVLIYEMWLWRPRGDSGLPAVRKERARGSIHPSDPPVGSP